MKRILIALSVVALGVAMATPATAGVDCDRKPDHPACICGDVLRGAKQPLDCKVFGTACTPETPIGACMVSSEGACAAEYMYGKRLVSKGAATIPFGFVMMSAGLAMSPGVNATYVSAPIITSGAVSPIARETARITPVRIPGNAAGKT